jgi:predicted Fe-S protein YdhL (DUF1289 family)
MESPCKQKCILTERGICLGCGRTKEEIERWSAMTDSERHEVMVRLESLDEALE